MRGIKCYQVKVSAYKSFRAAQTVTKTVKKTKFVLKSSKIKNKKKLFIKSRAFKIIKGKKYFGNWSKVIRIRITK